ncbi:hypothetical protein L873DRAFT_1097506 [Choiromyces venosus 120613-1]|uniref:Uncharacterized protein n=1 Tax=Choiromyces venosus 120613-1 TaxID=1336337 RepID=A0A3N4JH65_9PEZI|nr:hypothetical protein L873DRAFT_1097506 [Choiromyces venosus 120613-1]
MGADSLFCVTELLPTVCKYLSTCVMLMARQVHGRTFLDISTLLVLILSLQYYFCLLGKRSQISSSTNNITWHSRVITAHSRFHPHPLDLDD